jgi:hypothetical protein
VPHLDPKVPEAVADHPQQQRRLLVGQVQLHLDLPAAASSCRTTAAPTDNMGPWTPEVETRTSRPITQSRTESSQ